MIEGIDFGWLTGLAQNVGIAIATLIAAYWVSALVARRLRKLGKKYEALDETLFGFFASLARYSILAVSVIFILARFGVETTSLVALLGAAGLAIGLALQGTLSNLAAGVMLLAFRPFKVGDFIAAGGQSGTVQEIGLFTVEIATLDNLKVIIPNGDIWAASITNYSAYPTRRVDLVFGVSYATDLKRAEEILHRVVAEDSRIHAEPEPWINVTNLNASSVDFTVRVWCDRGDFAGVKFDLMRKVKDAFDAEGIEIPFPTVTQIQVQS